MPITPTQPTPIFIFSNSKENQLFAVEHVVAHKLVLVLLSYE